MDDPIKIDSGLISGASSGEFGDVSVYRGIPYSAPPIADLRWKPPQPAAAWSGTRACIEFGPACPQPKSFAHFPTNSNQSEDCLYLNVWTPARSVFDALPVMVWIHGGSFVTGSGDMLAYDGTALARLGVVVVTINYRLGPFGYMAHPSLSKESPQGASGNYGHLDQIAALLWVQRNIASFGGDPQCVTIFGESAGAIAVCRLMVSPLAKGLFHRAIAQSGAAHGRNRMLREAEADGERIAAALGCDREENPVAALRGKTPEELLTASNPVQGLRGKGFKFGPIVDGWAIPENPARMFEAGKQHAVPLLLGTNADEGTMFLPQTTVHDVEGYRLMVKAGFREHAEEALRAFPCDTPEQLNDALNRFITVTAFAGPARMLAMAMAEKQLPVFMYHFSRVPPGVVARKKGAAHAAEVPYVFGTLIAVRMPEEDRLLMKTMMECWVQFAREGTPNGEGLPEWPAYTSIEDRHLEFGDSIRISSGLYKEACDLVEKASKTKSAP